MKRYYTVRAIHESGNEVAHAIPYHHADGSVSVGTRLSPECQLRTKQFALKARRHLAIAYPDHKVELRMHTVTLVKS